MNMRNVLLLLWVFNLLSSCGQKSQYEILSPCVSADIQSDIFVINPCARRPVNRNIA